MVQYEVIGDRGILLGNTVDYMSGIITIYELVAHYFEIHMKYILLTFSFIFLIYSFNTQAKPNYWVKHSGDRMNILKKGDLNGTIDLQNLENVEHLFALGPLEGLKGEITINGSKPFISTLTQDRKQKDISSFNHKAIFLVYGSVNEWQEITINKELNSLNEIEEFVKDKAANHNLPLNIAFPFKIRGVAEKITYHVIYKQNNAPHNKKEHQRSKIKFNKENEKSTIIGFWSSEEGEGVYTHPNKRTHMHYISGSSNDSGHIDSIKLNHGAVLLIPKPNE